MKRTFRHLVPYLVVVGASVGASIGYTSSVDSRITANQRAILVSSLMSCERGNILRANQVKVVDTLVAIINGLNDRTAAGLDPIDPTLIRRLRGIPATIPPVACQRQLGSHDN